MLEKVFNLKKDEMRVALPFLGLLVCLFSGVTVARNVAMSLVVADFGKDSLPLMFALIGVFQLVFSVVYAGLSEHFSPGVLYKKLLLVLGVFCLVGFGLMLAQLKIASAILYVGLFVLLPVVAMHDGTHVAAYLNAYEQKKLAGFISAGIPLGAMLGGAILFLLLGHLAPVWLLLFLPASVLATVAAVIWIGKQRISILKEGNEKPKANPVDQMKEGLKASSGVPLLKWIAGGVLLSTLLQQFMVYYYQGVIYPKEFPDPAARAAFFGKYDLIMNFLALAFQLLLASRIINRLGVGLASLIHPALYAGSSILLIFSQGLGAGIFAQLVNQELRTYFRKPVDNLLYNGLQSKLWGVAKAFLGGIVQPIAILLSTLVLVVLRAGFGSDWMNEILKVLMVIISIAGVLLVFPQGKAYDRGVLNLLRKRGLPTDKMGELPPALVAAQAHTLLVDKNHNNVLLGLELLRQINRPEDIPTVAALLRETENKTVAQACLENLGRFPGEEAAFQPLLDSLLKFKDHHEFDVLVSEALVFLSPYDKPEVLPIVMELLENKEIPGDELGAAANYLAHSKHFSDFSPLKIRAMEILQSDSDELKTQGLDMLGMVKENDVREVVLPFLSHPVRDIRAAAYRCLANLFPDNDEEIQEIILEGLLDTQPPVRLEAFKFACNIPDTDEALFKRLLPMVGDHSPKISHLAEDYFSARLSETSSLLKQNLLSQENSFILRKRLLTLLMKNPDESLKNDLENSALEALGKVLRCQATLHRMNEELKNSDMNFFVSKTIAQLEKNQILFAVDVAVMLSEKDEDFFQRVSMGLFSNNKQDRGLAFEAISQLNNKNLAGKLLRILEDVPMSLAQADSHFQHIFGEPLPLHKNISDDLIALYDLYLQAVAWRLTSNEIPTDPQLKRLLA